MTVQTVVTHVNNYSRASTACDDVTPVEASARARVRHNPGPSRGDQRRAALLSALEQLLTERSLAEIGVADISGAAGLTRSAFYFYFPTKGAAVAALLSDFRQEMYEAAAGWYEGGPGTPLERIHAGFTASVELWRARGSLLVALLDAIGTDPEVRQIWESWTQGFIERIADRILEDRRAGLAHGTADPEALATALMGAALYSMERDVRATLAGRSESDALLAALVVLWHRTLYVTG
jgi:AcrR family transcriptional regulator